MLTRRDAIRAAIAALTLPALPFSTANALAAPTAVVGPCPEFPFFGAHYPDATCIDGLLWDLDSDDGGFLSSGGDIPCPYCNAKEFLEYDYWNIKDDGWMAFTDGLPPSANPFIRGSRFPHLTVAFQDMWRDGYREAAVDPDAIADRKRTTK